MPKEHESWLAGAVVLMRTWWRARPPVDGPVRVTIRVLIRAPMKARLSPNAPSSKRILGRPAPRKPDVDNVAKIVLDAAVRAGVIADDDQVTDLLVKKRYTAVDEAPGVGFMLTEDL